MSENIKIVDDNQFLQELGFSSQDEGEIITQESVSKEGNMPPIVDTPSTDEDNPVEEKTTETPTDSQKGEREKQPEDVTQETESLEDQVEKEEENTRKRFGVKDSILSLVETGHWEDISVKVGDKEYDSLEELLAKEKPTKELFDSLSELQRNIREESLQSRYLKLEGLDDTRKLLVETIAKGEVPQEVINYHNETIDPIQNLDFKDLNTLEGFVRQCLVEVDNFPPKYVENEIQSLKDNFQLLDVGEKYKKLIVDDYKEQLQAIQEKNAEMLLQREKEREESIKTFETQLKENKYSDPFIKKATALRYNTDEEGVPHYIRLIEEKITAEPDFSRKLIHFLLDEQDFVNKVKRADIVESKKQVYELIGMLPRKGGGKNRKTSEGSKSISESEAEFLKSIGI